MITNDVLGPVHFQSSSEMTAYPRQPLVTKRCDQRAMNKVIAPAQWVFEKTCELIQLPFRNIIFHASSKKFHDKIDDARLEESRAILRKIGGATQVLMTSDGAVIESMYMNVQTFKQRVYEMGGQFQVRVTQNGEHEQVLYVFTSTLKNLCDKLGIPLAPGVVRGWVATLTRPGTPSPLLQNSTPGVTILTQGNASVFEFDRARITSTLLSGQHCMVFNVRGTGRSQGLPSEIGSYRDLEAVYQYLTRVKGFPNCRITVLGYCLGGGTSTELAKNHPGVNLTMDRCFISMGDMVAVGAASIVSQKLGYQGPKVEQTKQLARLWLKPVVDHVIFGYNNAGKLPKVKGTVCVIDALQDDVIPQDAGAILRHGVSSTSRADITLNGGHCDPWDDAGQVSYSTHLQRVRKLRDFGNTEMSQVALDAAVTDMGSLGMFGSIQSSAMVGSRAAHDHIFDDYGAVRGIGLSRQ